MGIHFTKEEFADRKSRVVKQLKNQGLDALLMFRQESMYWLTGYDTFGYVYFQCLVLTSKGNLILLTRAPDLRQAQNTSIINDIRIWVDKDKSNPADELKNILSELNLEKSNIGVEYEAYGLTGRNAIKLNNSLKNFASNHAEFSVTVEGFNHFDKEVIFAHVEQSPPIMDFQKSFIRYWTESLGAKSPKHANSYHPHITLAFRNLTPVSFTGIWEKFGSLPYTRQFNAKEMVLLKHQTTGWEIEERFTLAHPSVAKI